ncbi:TIGR01777 family oxidoreductase [Arthrobacter sp. 35W]|uniref:TIGR01777 family oxidoreductase n=1 Tax=Arthrobacter sp. 35W TaxID=1132441 RepID=UPI000400C980|nr:TIGR01777 family oxidoreductase [Arthrobacter sp. 35W]
MSGADATGTVVLAGAGGFIGRDFRRRFEAGGWKVRTIGRTGGGGVGAVWGDTAGMAALLEGADLLVNLAGRSVSCRYTARNRAEILDSRVSTTAELGRAVAACATPPRDWFNASTGTIYRSAEGAGVPAGGFPEDDGGIGSGFSVDVARAWERTLAQAQTPSTRRIPLRITIVLGPGGGVMRPFVNLARLGLGGRMGPGTQWFSWIHLEDLYRAVLFLHRHGDITGPVNVASPNAVGNAGLMAAVRSALKVPFGLPTPAWLLKMGAVLIRTETELVLKSRWVRPQKLIDAGFQWHHPDLDEALADILAVDRG